jgi:TPR repeat protein
MISACACSRAFGIEKNEKEAMTWIKKAADAGLPVAMLKSCRARERAVAEGRRRCSEGRHPVGLFLEAEGLEKNGKVVDAFAYYSLAAESAHDEAAKRRDGAKGEAFLPRRSRRRRGKSPRLENSLLPRIPVLTTPRRPCRMWRSQRYSRAKRRSVSRARSRSKGPRCPRSSAWTRQTSAR